MKKIDREAIAAASDSFFSIHTVDSTSSTNDRLKKISRDIGSGFVLIAANQTGGRGRNGKIFHSRPGGLYMSFILKENKTPQRVMRYTAAAAVAVNRAIMEICGLETDIKWVNDIEYNGKKLAGILCETALKAGQNLCEYIIVGIGVNVYTTDFPDAISHTATSLRLEGSADADINLLAAGILNNFLQYKDSGDMADVYRRSSCVLNRDVYISRGGFSRQVRALDIDENGALIVQEKDGKILTLDSGLVTLRKEKF